MAEVQIGPQFLWDLGYQNLTREQTRDASSAIFEALEYGVGRRLARAMTENQLKEFERLAAGGNQAAALAWLEKNFPLYRSVVNDETDALKRRLREALQSMRGKHSGSSSTLVSDDSAQGSGEK